MASQSHKEELEQKRSYWKRHIDQWQSSGLTQTGYCQHNELKYHQFVYWKKRFEQSETSITFVPLNIPRSVNPPTSMNPHALRLIVADDLQIEISPGFDPQLLRQLVSTLRTLS